MQEKEIIKATKWSVLPLCIGISVVGLVLGLILVFTSTEYSWHSGASYFWTSIVPYYFSMSFLPLLVIAIFIYFMVAKTELTITDKRVYGKAMFGKRVDLPMDSISAVGTSMFKGIAVATSSGKIKFLGISNRDEIHKEISNLIVNRQDKVTKTDIKQEIAQSSADELRKYKDLLDQGIITEEEFGAKKKQLLGL